MAAAATLIQQQTEQAAADQTKKEENDAAARLLQQQTAEAAARLKVQLSLKRKNQEQKATTDRQPQTDEVAALQKKKDEDEHKDGDVYRYSKLVPILPGDALDTNHYMTLYDAMTRYYGIDKDSEVICPGDSRYAVFIIRVHTFDFEAENALKEYNELMDIVYEPVDETDHQETHGSDDETSSSHDMHNDLHQTSLSNTYRTNTAASILGKLRDASKKRKKGMSKQPGDTVELSGQRIKTKKKKKKVIDQNLLDEEVPVPDVTQDAATSMKQKKKKRSRTVKDSRNHPTGDVNHEAITSVPPALIATSMAKKRGEKKCSDNHDAPPHLTIEGRPNQIPASCNAKPSWSDIAKEIAKLYVEQAHTEDTSSKQTKPSQPLKQNSRVRNLMVAMRRNFRQEDKNRALAPFTITRDKMDQVRHVAVNITYLTTLKMCIACCVTGL